MGATTQPQKPHRPAPLRRLAAAFALAAVLLIGAMATAAVAAPRTAPGVNKDVTPTAQHLPTPRAPAFVLPLVLGALFFLAAMPPTLPRFGGGGGR
jgi:hypothetical protein